MAMSASCRTVLAPLASVGDRKRPSLADPGEADAEQQKGQSGRFQGRSRPSAVAETDQCLQKGGWCEEGREQLLRMPGCLRLKSDGATVKAAVGDRQAASAFRKLSGIVALAAKDRIASLCKVRDYAKGCAAGRADHRWMAARQR